MSDNRKIKILHFIESEGLYGAENVILNLSREMQNCASIQPVVGCIVSSSHERSELHAKAGEYGIPAEKIVIRNAALPVDIPRAAIQLRRKGVSLIHSHGYKPSVFGFIISILSGIPIMATCHLWFLRGKIPVKMRVMVRTELFLYKFFPIVVSVSEPIKQTLIKNGIPSRKIRVIRNGIFINDYISRDKNRLKKLRSQLGLGEMDTCILNIGRLHPQKAQNSIIEAARIVVSAGYRAKFLIAGEGPLRKELEKNIRVSGLENNVYLLGFREDVKNLLEISDIFVLPSLDEGMPISLLEAAATRTPIIATPVGDIPEFITNGETGLLVKVGDTQALADAIICLINEDNLRNRMSNLAFEQLELAYSSNVMFKKYQKLYDAILKSDT